jgi:hypothetical protein
MHTVSTTYVRLAVLYSSCGNNSNRRQQCMFMIAPGAVNGTAGMLPAPIGTDATATFTIPNQLAREPTCTGACMGSGPTHLTSQLHWYWFLINDELSVAMKPLLQKVATHWLPA